MSAQELHDRLEELLEKDIIDPDSIVKITIDLFPIKPITLDVGSVGYTPEGIVIEASQK